MQEGQQSLVALLSSFLLLCGDFSRARSLLTPTPVTWYSFSNLPVCAFLQLSRPICSRSPVHGSVCGRILETFRRKPLRDNLWSHFTWRKTVLFTFRFHPQKNNVFSNFLCKDRQEQRKRYPAVLCYVGCILCAGKNYRNGLRSISGCLVKWHVSSHRTLKNESPRVASKTLYWWTTIVS